MKIKYRFKMLVLPVFALITLSVFGGFNLSLAESSELSTAVFTVQ